ncbi:MAG: hypothetical protein QMD99_24170, partial [Rhizobiaceae bacterium]|nr:hypothetical protein [Rhizobiaceae bacterium]
PLAASQRKHDSNTRRGIFEFHIDTPFIRFIGSIAQEHGGIIANEPFKSSWHSNITIHSLLQPGVGRCRIRERAASCRLRPVQST